MTTTPTDQAFWDQVPSITDVDSSHPQATAVADARSPLIPTATRRSTLKALGVLGGAMALNVLSWIPPALQRPASATVGTEYLGCANYDGWSGYDNNTQACVGAPYSRDNCGNDGWFLQYSGTCFASGAVVACGNGITQKNAWRWPHSGTTYRCADGVQYWCGGQEFRICSWANP